MIDFDKWWKNVGSGIIPLENDDMESHANRIALEAWKAAIKMEDENGRTENI